MTENTKATNFEPHECVIFVQSTKMGNHENKAIHSTRCPPNSIPGHKNSEIPVKRDNVQFHCEIMQQKIDIL